MSLRSVLWKIFYINILCMFSLEDITGLLVLSRQRYSGGGEETGGD